MATNVNINQFEQAPVRGQLDLQVMKSGVIQGIVSADQGTALAAGDRMKLDTASGNIPSFIAAGIDDPAIGCLVFDEKKASPVAGDVIQVTFFGGPVMWLQAGAAVVAGVPVEYNSSGKVITLTTNKQVGIALVVATAADQVIRVILRDAAIQDYP